MRVFLAVGALAAIGVATFVFVVYFRRRVWSCFCASDYDSVWGPGGTWGSSGTQSGQAGRAPSGGYPMYTGSGGSPVMGQVVGGPGAYASQAQAQAREETYRDAATGEIKHVVTTQKADGTVERLSWTE
mmetsp:Transcript_152076/g.265099  ORF Transcript_152076/g.265099 Transcript_152076/m.265099 type:complete len:129 (-) Transcript_152076:153-539(-)